MIAYLDASVVLRRLLGQPAALSTPEWESIDAGIVSRLVEVECLRTVDLARVLGRLSDGEVAVARAAALDFLSEMEIVEITRVVLSRASQPMPTRLGTLDAIHLSTALLWRESTGESLTMATHDGALATAARAHGLPVIGG